MRMTIEKRVTAIVRKTGLTPGLAEHTTSGRTVRFYAGEALDPILELGLTYDGRENSWTVGSLRWLVDLESLNSEGGAA